MSTYCFVHILLVIVCSRCRWYLFPPIIANFPVSIPPFQLPAPECRSLLCCPCGRVEKPENVLSHQPSTDGSQELVSKHPSSLASFGITLRSSTLAPELPGGVSPVANNFLFNSEPFIRSPLFWDSLFHSFPKVFWDCFSHKVLVFKYLSRLCSEEPKWR